MTSRFILAAALLYTSTTTAAEYHVAPNGSDRAAGTADAPWKTIRHAADVLRPGDTCIVHAGTYRETVRPARSGTAGKPIRLVAAEGEAVLMTGTEAIERWSRHRGSIYVADVDWPVDQVFIDRRMMVPARSPNLGEDWYKPKMLSIESVEGECRVRGESWAKDHWKGGILWGMNERAWVAVTRPIVGSDGNTLELEGRGPLRDGEKGLAVLTGALGALDAEREWHQQDGRLYLWAPGGGEPGASSVEATRRRWAFDLAERSHIEVRGFKLLAASINMDQAEYCMVDEIRARAVSFDRVLAGGFNRDKNLGPQSEGLGIVLGGHHNTLRNSVIAYCTGDGVSVFGSDNRVENCVIHDCNLSASDCAPVNCTGSGHAVVGCTLFNAVRSILVHRKLGKGRIEHNHLYNAGLMMNDLGATYTFQTDGQGTVIAYNRVHDVHCHTGVGIYIDNMSPNHVVHHNLAYNNEDCGLRLNTPTANVLIYHNTFARNGRTIAWWDSKKTGEMTGCRLINNIMTDSVALGPGAESEHNFLGPDPKFVDPAAGDFRLTADSPCINAGTVVPGISGRHDGTAPDIGCFEHGKTPWTAGSTLPRGEWDEAGW